MLYLIVIIIAAILIVLRLANTQPPTQVEDSHDINVRPPLTDAHREAIRQADEAFDWQTHNAIINGTYTGPLPEYIVANHWTDLYPDLYHTRIAGINFRRGIKNLAGTYFDALLIDDPKNKFDKNAIKIIHATDSRHLGFIPSDETDDVRHWIDNRFPYPCRARIDEFEEWDEDKERDVVKLYGEINIKKPAESKNVSPTI